MISPKIETVPPPTPEKLKEFTGMYESEELKTFYEVDIVKDQLVARHMHHGDISLTPAWKDEFRGGQWFMNAIEFYRDENGNVAGFKVNQTRNRNQRFIKK